MKFFDVKKDDIPKGLLRSPNAKNYQKLMYSAFSFSPRYFIRCATNMVLSKPLKELGLEEWIHGVERGGQYVTEESKQAVERLKQWQEGVKDMFENDFFMQTLEGNKQAQWFLEKRIHKKYNDKVILAQAQLELAKEMNKNNTAPVNVTFTMG